MPDADLIVEVDAPAPVVVETTPATEATPEPALKPAKVEPGPVEDLKAQLETLQAARTADATARQRAEADAHAARAEATQAKAAVVDANISTVDSAIAAAAAEAEGFARDQEAALAASNWKLAAELGRKAARAEARIEQLEDGKATLAARKAEPPKPQAQTVQQTAFEQAISGSAPRAQAWLRAHPTYVTDPELNAQAALAHQRAMKQGIAPDSDAYFDFCERDLGLKQAPVVETKPPKPQQRAAAMPSAPVSRDGGASGGSLSPTSVTLTPGEQRAATDGSVVWNYSDPKIGAVKGNPVGLKEYAKRKAAMTQDGRYDRSYTEQ